MIRRRVRTARQQARLAYLRAAPIGIAETRDEATARAEAVERAVISAVHDWIWTNRPACQLCHGQRTAECMGLPDEMHEDPSRAQTRGRPAWERFNLLVCGRLCAACHRDVTEGRLWIRFGDPRAGFMGPVRGSKEE